jgi:hypothetical protein
MVETASCGPTKNEKRIPSDSDFVAVAGQLLSKALGEMPMVEYKVNLHKPLRFVAGFDS